MSTPGGSTGIESNMIRFWSILTNTFVQSIRRPIFGVLVLVTFGMLVLTLPLSGWSMGVNYEETDQKLLVNLGLSTLLGAGLFIAAFSAAGTVGREIEKRTALTVISKPVSRTVFVLGKFAGTAAAVSLAFYLCSIVFLLTVRHRVMPAAVDPFDWPVIVLGFSAFGGALLIAVAGNFLFGWTFTSAAVWATTILLTAAMGVITVVGKEWKIVPFGEGLDPQILLAMLLTFLAVMVFVAVAVAASTRLGQIATLMLCLAVFFVGSMHPYLFGRWSEQVPAARIAGWAAPNLLYFYALDALMMDTPIPVTFVAVVAIYCACYVAGVLAIGVGLFQTRQLEAQGSSASLPGAISLLAWLGRTASLAVAFAGTAVLSMPHFHTLRGVGTGLALLAGGVGGWILWGLFARGVRWCYWLALAAAVVKLAASVAAFALPTRARTLALTTDPALQVMDLVFTALVVLVVLLPSSRRHFRPEPV